jgi:hypothetical protein
METTSAVIIIAELLMFLSSVSGHPNTSLALFHRYGQVWDNYKWRYNGIFLGISHYFLCIRVLLSDHRSIIW